MSEWAPAFVHFVRGLPVDLHAQQPVAPITPAGLRHFVPVRAKPYEILHSLPRDRVTSEEASPPQDRVVATDREYLAHESKELPLARADVPIHPADLVVLAIPVVVSSLRASQLVAVGEAGHPLRERKRGKEIALYPFAHTHDGTRLRGPLDTPVPALIPVRPVLVAFPVP